MISLLARQTVLALALAMSALAVQAGISEARFLSDVPESHPPVAPSEIRLLDQDGEPGLRIVGVVEAVGKEDAELDRLEQVNGLRLPGPLPFFDSSPAKGDNDASLAMRALKALAARHGVHALFIVKSERAEVRNNVVGHRIVAKAFRKTERGKSSTGPR